MEEINSFILKNSVMASVIITLNWNCEYVPEHYSRNRRGNKITKAPLQINECAVLSILLNSSA
jgi:hypothetical protein